VLEEAKRLAAREGITLRALMEEGLRMAIEERSRQAAFSLRKATHSARPSARGARRRLESPPRPGLRGPELVIAIDTNILPTFVSQPPFRDPGDRARFWL